MPNVVFQFPHYKSMENLSCHSKQTKELNFIKNTKPVKCNMVNISIESQPHRAYGFCGDDILFLCMAVDHVTFLLSLV